MSWLSQSRHVLPACVRKHVTSCSNGRANIDGVSVEHPAQEAQTPEGYKGPLELPSLEVDSTEGLSLQATNHILASTNKETHPAEQLSLSGRGGQAAATL